MTRKPSLAICTWMVAVAVSSLAFTQSRIPDEVQAIAGRYEGEWTSYGIEESGQVGERMSWSDVLIAANPTSEGGKAFVTFTNTMTALGAEQPFMTVTGKEGYILDDAGEAGDYFIETFGQTYRANRLSANAWAYAMAAHPQELASLGFSNVMSGQHIMVKVHANEGGVATHRISRVTTVHWKDVDGMSRWMQFTSLRGVHRRVSSANLK